jgi:anti-sigma B factor antagonist
LRDTARKLIAENKRLVLDLSDVSYLDSSGLGMIVGVHISAKKARCQLKLINLSPRVKEIFTLTRLDEALAGHGRVSRSYSGLETAVCRGHTAFSRLCSPTLIDRVEI